MGKKYGWLATVVFLLFVMLILLPAAAKESHIPLTEQLVGAVEESGATVTAIEFRSSIKQGNINSPKDLQKLGEFWAGILNVTSAETSVQLEKGNYVYQILSKDAAVECRLRVIGVPKEDHLDAYLVLFVSGKPEQLQDIESKKKSVEAALQAAELIPQFSTCVRGTYSDKLFVDQQESKILSIFSTLQATELERLQDETVVSISGYSAAWKPFIAINDQKMNVQVATHRDTQTKGTSITVGTPIITAEY